MHQEPVYRWRSQSVQMHRVTVYTVHVGVRNNSYEDAHRIHAKAEFELIHITCPKAHRQVTYSFPT